MEPLVKIPAALIEVLDAHGRIHTSHRISGVNAISTIGRSVACDIVLDDAYAAGEHTQVTLHDDGRVSIRDLGSRNGTRFDSKLVTESLGAVDHGELIVGRTRLRIRTSHIALPAEKLFRRDLLQRYKTSMAIIGLLLTMAYAAFDQWLTAPEALAPRVLATALGVLVVLGIWVGTWGLITRLGHGIWGLRTHAAIAANALAIGAWLSWLLDAASFAIQWRLVGVAVAIVFASVVGALYLHLRKATHLGVRSAAAIGIAVPLLLAISAGWLTQQSTLRNVNRLNLGIAVYPPTLRMTPSADLNDFLAQAESLKRDANRARQQSLADFPLTDATK
jgi:FHA domain